MQFRSVVFFLLTALRGRASTNVTSHGRHVSKSKWPFGPSPIIDPPDEISCSNFVCETDSNCDDYPLRVCHFYSPCKQRMCLHKELWPLLPQDLYLFVAMFVVSFLAGAPGIGGGGINVPMLMILGKFDIKEAVPLSHIAVMGNAMSQLFMNTPKRHPHAIQRPLIHYEMAALLLPAMLGGNSLGVVVGRVFPPTLMIVLSLVLLVLTSAKTFLKGCHQMRDHQQARALSKSATKPQVTQAVRAPADRRGTGDCASAAGLGLTAGRGHAALLGDAGDVLTGRCCEPTLATGQASTSSAASAPRPWPRVSEDLGLDLRGEVVRTWSGNVVVQATPRRLGGLWDERLQQQLVKMRVPWKVINFMIMFNLLFCIDFMVLSKDVPGVDIRKCTASYWVVLLGLYPVVAVSLIFGIKMLRCLDTWHRLRGDAPVPGDPVINGRTVVLYPGLAVLVGGLAGLLGLGGGEFLVPLLLEIGLNARVASATSGFMIFFNTSSNVVHYALSGTIEPFLGYGFAYFFIAMLGSLAGLLVGCTKFVQERGYIIVYLVAFLLFASAGLLVYRGLQMDVSWRFNNFCH